MKDLYREQRFIIMKTVAPGDFVPGWLASLGTTLFKDKFFIKASLDSPFAATPTAPSALQADYPHAKASMGLKEGIIPNISLTASYEKYFIGRAKAFLDDLVDPTDAMIGLAVNYRIGASVLTLLYDAVWDPAKYAFEIHSSLIASVKF